MTSSISRRCSVFQWSKARSASLDSERSTMRHLRHVA
jgi:hypothetical protein